MRERVSDYVRLRWEIERGSRNKYGEARKNKDRILIVYSLICAPTKFGDTKEQDDAVLCIQEWLRWHDFSNFPLAFSIFLQFSYLFPPTLHRISIIRLSNVEASPAFIQYVKYGVALYKYKEPAYSPFIFRFVCFDVSNWLFSRFLCMYAKLLIM